MHDANKEYQRSYGPVIFKATTKTLSFSPGFNRVTSAYALIHKNRFNGLFPAATGKPALPEKSRSHLRAKLRKPLKRFV
jgi:hypothetical protein